MNKEFDYDEYGFYVPLQRIKLQQDKSELKKINARVEKWRKMLPNIHQLIDSADKQLKRRIRKGIPDGIRVKVWPFLSQSAKVKQKYNDNTFATLVKQTDFPYQSDIEADLNRTFPNHQLFQNNRKAGIEALSNILKSVSIAHKDVGYCQGLNFIAAVSCYFYLFISVGGKLIEVRRIFR